MNAKKTFGFLGIALAMGSFPSFASADDIIPFSRHCDKNIEINDFALVQSRPMAQNTPLSEADNGGWVAIYEVPEVPSTNPDSDRAKAEEAVKKAEEDVKKADTDYRAAVAAAAANPTDADLAAAVATTKGALDTAESALTTAESALATAKADNPVEIDPIPLTISGSVNHDRSFVSICEGNEIVAIIPTYFQNETDEDKKFSFSFDIGFQTKLEDDKIHETISAVLENPRFQEGKDGDIIETSLDKCSVDINDSSTEYKKIILQDGSLNPEISDHVRCIAPNGDQLLGGLAYHEVYASVEREDRVIDSTDGTGQQANRSTTAFGIENYDRATTFNYAIFPPLEELSGCNGSSIAKLSVEDVRCLSMDRQVEFKRYFLGLPEVIQKLFDFDSGTEDEAADFASNPHPLLVNYFNETIPADEKESDSLPLDGEWLSISATNGKHRYMPSFSVLPEEDSALENGLISYYDEAEADCGPEEDGGSCWEEDYRGENGCKVDQESYFSEVLGTGAAATANPTFPQGCNGGVFPTLESDQAALLEHVGITDPNHPKVIAVSKMNATANEVCNDARDTAEGEFTMIQAVNAASVEINQFMADLDARYEGFGACEKIQAINTMSGMMDRMLGMLGREVDTKK